MHIGSDNSADNARANVGNTITIHITSSEIIIQPLVQIANQVSTVIGTGMNWVASVVLSQLAVDAESDISITFEDLAGNSGQVCTSTTDESAVVVDLTSPKMMHASIVSNNDVGTTIANAGDAITMSLASSEKVQLPKILIAGQSSVVEGDADCMHFSATYMVVATVESTTDASSVSIDLTPPTLSQISILSSNVEDSQLANGGDEITVVVQSSEAICSPAVMIANQPAAVSGTGSNFNAVYIVQAGDVNEGTSGLSVTYRDIAGNVGVTQSVVTDSSRVVIDLTPPAMISVSISSDNTVDATRANVGDIIKLQLLASEKIVTPRVRIDNDNAVIVGNGRVFTASFSTYRRQPCRWIRWPWPISDRIFRHRRQSWPGHGCGNRQQRGLR